MSSTERIDRGETGIGKKLLIGLMITAVPFGIAVIVGSLSTSSDNVPFREVSVAQSKPETAIPSPEGVTPQQSNSTSDATAVAATPAESVPEDDYKLGFGLGETIGENAYDKGEEKMDSDAVNAGARKILYALGKNNAPQNSEEFIRGIEAGYYQGWDNAEHSK
jgi:hypothetical protein